jgi:hypothetical protein
VEDDDWWQTGPPEMYAPAPTPDVRRVSKVVAVVGDALAATYLGPVSVETWAGQDAPKHQFDLVVTDQPDVPLECRDGVRNTWNYWTDVHGIKAAGLRVLRNPFEYWEYNCYSRFIHQGYQLVSGCKKIQDLPNDERAQRRPTVAGSLNKPCSQCPFVEIVLCL